MATGRENMKKKILASDENKNGQGRSYGAISETSRSPPSDNEVVTQQPKRNDTGGPSQENGDDDGKKSSVNKEGPSAEIKLDAEKILSEDGCISASAGVGSISKDYMDGAINVKYVGPNVGCVMSCPKFPHFVTDCTLELCSANYLLGLILCKIGLAFDTKLIWTEESVVAEALGTGFDTSEGFAVGALGCKIGLGNKEKREKKWTEMKLKWQKKNVTTESDEGENEGKNAGEEKAETD